MKVKHAIVVVLELLHRDSTVLQDMTKSEKERTAARARFEANLRSLGVDAVEAQTMARQVA